VILAIAGRVEHHDDGEVRDEEHGASRLRRAATPEGRGRHDQPERERRDLDLAEAEREWDR
jgi:hypothetical protein